MAFVDELNIYIQAGKGGNGVVRWRHEKGKEFSGPSGGDGGNGADVYIKGIKDAGYLERYKNKKEFIAEDGADGSKNSMTGKGGEDLEIVLPIGSVVKNQSTGEVFEILDEDQRIKILSGGVGGFGNEHFKSSTNINPIEFTKGSKGESADFTVELQLIADVGLVGLPNAGKSSLLNELTRSRSKVDSYAFTTLDPHLGVYYGIVIADIPGLIEGASTGKGLGHKFLRHIKRTKVLAHCISCENGEEIENVYKTIRAELENYDSAMIDKPEIIILTKKDVVDESTLRQYKEIFSKYSNQILTVSILDESSLKECGEEIKRVVDYL